MMTRMMKNSPRKMNKMRVFFAFLLPGESPRCEIDAARSAADEADAGHVANIGFASEAAAEVGSSAEMDAAAVVERSGAPLSPRESPVFWPRAPRLPDLIVATR